ncbi:MAG: TonB family protein [Terriglobia bacterium]
MKPWLLALMVLGSARALMTQAQTVKLKPPLQPAEALSVTDITVPDLPVTNGTVVVDALITEAGKVERVEVRRDIANFTELAVHAVEEWKFSPATLAGKPVASRVPVAVTFRPPVSYADPVPLPTLIPQSETAIQAEFQPAEVIHAAFPNYPANTVVVGTVVLEVTLSATGKVGEIKVLRDLPPLTEEAKAAAGDWRFMPATFNGEPVRSKIILAFVFTAIFSQS